ncbi:MAG: apolipoprotein N-acyltransferase [Gammaproteobacteria bacterium]|nr:apolipoprotein N-acyltransferase [Gammaproteobacteria bacterium]MBU1416374.1 apolipoprotein N-acyltransferase [Gammaproteobacteria bacterium]
MRQPLLVALLAGATTAFGFAPFDLFPVPFATLGVLFALWRRAATSRGAAWLGFTWGIGCFLAGVSWVYVSLHDVGGMVMPLAVAATLAFCAVLAVFPALAGYLYRRVATRLLAIGGAAQTGPRLNAPAAPVYWDILLLAGVWVLTEWLRGWVLTGFPWLAIGYSQTPPSPLAGYAPIIGVFGISLLVAGVSSWLTFAWRKPLAWIAVAAIFIGGQALRGVEWTQPVGEPVTVSLLQGNIPQSLKWVPGNLPLSMNTYAQLAAEHPAQLVVLPETAIPLLFDQIPRDLLRRFAAAGDVLIGSAVRSPDGGYTNGAIALTPELQMQHYSKVHLVPYGEYVPPGFAWFFGLVNIPMSNFRPGPPNQKPLAAAGQRVMPNICYEDLFGEEILAGLPEATLLINLSNTAWFGDSLAQPQHLQIARMRALETGRPMLRATNTGMTAAIDPHGRVIAVLPPFVADALTVSVRGYAGSTPFSRVGNRAAVLLAALACLPALLAGQRRRRMLR